MIPDAINAVNENSLSCLLLVTPPHHWPFNRRYYSESAAICYLRVKQVSDRSVTISLVEFNLKAEEVDQCRKKQCMLENARHATSRAKGSWSATAPQRSTVQRWDSGTKKNSNNSLRLCLKAANTSSCVSGVCLWACLCLMGLVPFLHFSLSLILYFWYQSCPLSSFNSAHYYPAQLCWFICRKRSTCMSPIFSLLSRTFSLLFIASFFTEPRFHQPTGHKAFTVCCKCLLFSATQVSAFWEK